MKSSKKSVSFRMAVGEDARGAPDQRSRELGSATYEKRHFQAMLARLSQQRPKTSGFSKASRFQDDPPRRRPQSVGDIFSQRSKKPAVSSVSEKKKRTRVSSVSSSTSPSSSSLSSSTSSSPSCSSQLEVIGTRTAMISRRTPSPSLFMAGSPSPHHGVLPTKRRFSRSREILHKIQSELSQAKYHFSSDRVLSVQSRPLSRSLSEISNLVMELDNNLSVAPGQNDGGGQEGRALDKNHEVSDEEGKRDPSEVKAESLQYAGQIGRGCFAHVFKAKLFETSVAVKEFKGDEESSRRRRCLREAELLSRIRHPNVANLVAVCHEKNAIVLELVDGETLGAVIKSERLLEGGSVLAVCRDVLLALNYLHNLYPEPVIHLDVKSNNVLLAGVGGSAISAKLCDFGSARKLLDGKSKILLGGVAGTPAWMSPEVIEQAYVSVKADVYSFGVMLWEMLFGEVPYDGMDLEEVCGSICRGDHPVCRPDFQVRLPGICRLMERCWELCPSARPDCGQLMAELAKIRDVIDLRSVPSPPPLPPPPLPHARLPQPEELSGNRRSSVAAAGFNVTKEDLEAQRSRLRRTEDTLPPDDEHEADIEAASSRLLSHIMKRAIRERRTDSGWGQQDSSNAGDSQNSDCQSPWSVKEDSDEDPSSR